MEKSPGSAGGSAQASAPLPTAPPSYEEAVAYAGGIPNPSINTPPYPVGATPMPMPAAYNQPSKQTAMPMPMPLPTNYVAPNDPTSQSFNTEQNIVPPPEVRIIHQRVTYHLASHAVKMTCPTCQADIKTSTISDHQSTAHICCIVLCLFGCCLCSCLPYCMRAFMSVHHFCPNCKNYIGTWKG